MRRLFLALALLGAVAAAATAWAVEPDEILADKAMEARAREIGRDLRCLVCQNQSIDDSDAPLARDLRILVRERLQAGDSDAAAKQFIVDRYGDYVLLSPPVKASTIALWGGPVLLLALALAAYACFWRRRAGAEAVAPLSAQERARLSTLLDEREP